jgi:hypothetical protein
MTNRRFLNLCFTVALGVLIAAPAASSFAGVLLIAQGRLLDGVVMLLLMPAGCAYHWHDARFEVPHPRELIMELTKPYALGLLLGLVAAAVRWLSVS